MKKRKVANSTPKTGTAGVGWLHGLFQPNAKASQCMEEQFNSTPYAELT